MAKGNALAAGVAHRILMVMLAAAALMILTIAPEAEAQNATGARKIAMTFKGEILNTFSAQSCTSSDYDNQCYQNGPARTSTTCRCELYDVDQNNSKEKANGTLIGKATMAEIDFTFLGGNEFLGGLGSPGFCQPFFASAFIQGTKDNEQIDMVGTLCVSNSSQQPKAPMTGGFGIATSSGGHKGYGSFKGSLNENTGKLNLNFTGAAS
jgi:methionine-rich copper-binding protein CopC